MIRRFLAVFISIFLLLPLLSTQAHASEYFSREYDVVYTVKDDGMTNVSVTVTLTNKTSDYYASSDTITVGFDSITNLTARDPDGQIKPIVTKTDGGNAIAMTFNKRVVGKDKSLVFNVTFDTSDIARHAGKIWEINIPGIANPEEFEHFSAEVKVPATFGEPSYIKPDQPDKKLLFTKEQLGKSGISIAYGTEQVYSFSLVYHLLNRNVFPIRTEIALPPTTNYQDISIESMNPKPKNVSIDQDGNWLAEYELVPSQKMDVTVRGKAKLSNQPRKEILDAKSIALYTKELPYWQTNNTQIKELARTLKTPQAIYNYVVENLHYDFNRLTTEQPRLGAAKALQNQNSAVCLEFTDLFIALSRAAGIPAREVNGYAYTENAKQRPLSLVQDILHAWPEYYDKDRQMWIMVDPTWGNTTGGTDYFHVFDFDHIVFVRKGINSQYPIPAGGYKFSGDEKKKDISVQFAQSYQPDTPRLQITSDFPEKTFSGLPVSGKVTALNPGRTLFPEQTAVVLSDFLFPKRQEIHIDPIPPYGHKDIDVTFTKTPLFSDKLYDFTFNLQDTIIHKQVRVTPFVLSTTTVIGGIIGVILTIIILIAAFKAGRLLISRQR